MKSLLLLAGFVFIASLTLHSEDADEDEGGRKYVPPPGEPPPVAPPLKPGSPLDHLANDPKEDEPTPGYKEGRTKGTVYWVGHRFKDDQGGQGWGWIRESGDGWGSAKWVTIQETLGVAVAPQRKLTKSDGDVDWEFKMWGHYATYKAYDPHLDEEIPVFVLEGYEVIGHAEPLSNKVGAPGRPKNRPSGASSRSGRPILSDPDVD